jgi:hypothetical protein
VFRVAIGCEDVGVLLWPWPLACMIELVFSADKEIFIHCIRLSLLLRAASGTSPNKAASTRSGFLNLGSRFTYEKICILRPSVLKPGTGAASAIAAYRNNQLVVFL